MGAYPNDTIDAFTFQLAHEIDMGTNWGDVGLYNFSYPPPNVVTLRPSVVGETRDDLLQLDKPAVCKSLEYPFNNVCSQKSVL